MATLVSDTVTSTFQETDRVNKLTFHGLKKDSTGLLYYNKTALNSDDTVEVTEGDGFAYGGLAELEDNKDNSNANIKDSNTPRSSALALPLSLATQRGEAVTDVAKSIASIQKDMYAIEDTNNYNKAIPAINLEIEKKYSKYNDHW